MSYENAFSSGLDLDAMFDNADSINDDDIGEDLDEILNEKSYSNSENGYDSEGDVLALDGESTETEDDVDDIGNELSNDSYDNAEEETEDVSTDDTYTVNEPVDSIVEEPVEDTSSYNVAHDNNVSVNSNTTSINTNLMDNILDIGRILRISDVFRNLNSTEQSVVAQLVGADVENENAIIKGVLSSDNSISKNIEHLVNIDNIEHNSRQKRLLYILRINKIEKKNLGEFVGKIISERISYDDSTLYSFEETLENIIFENVDDATLNIFKNANKVFEVLK